jgi:hypothetical protein
MNRHKKRCQPYVVLKSQLMYNVKKSEKRSIRPLGMGAGKGQASPDPVLRSPCPLQTSGFGSANAGLVMPSIPELIQVDVQDS